MWPSAFTCRFIDVALFFLLTGTDTAYSDHAQSSRTNNSRRELNSRKPLPNIQYSSVAVQAADWDDVTAAQTNDFSAHVDFESPAALEQFQPAYHSSAASNPLQQHADTRHTNATNNSSIRDTSTQFPETNHDTAAEVAASELRLPLSTTPRESPDASQMRTQSERVSAGAHRRGRHRNDDSDDSSDSGLRRKEQARLDELRR